jgi:hypothetical protein
MDGSHVHEGARKKEGHAVRAEAPDVGIATSGSSPAVTVASATPDRRSRFTGCRVTVLSLAVPRVPRGQWSRDPGESGDSSQTSLAGMVAALSLRPAALHQLCDPP